jgi:hypothetical protein
VCRSPGGIGGLEHEFRAAERQVGPTTRKRDEIQIYVTVHEGDLYTHSNYVSTMEITDHQGVTAPNMVPTKVYVSSGFVDMPSIVQNIIGDKHFTMRDYEAIEKSLTFHVSHSVFVDKRWKRLNFGESRVGIIDPDGTRWETSHIDVLGHHELVIQFRPYLYVRPEHASVMAKLSTIGSTAFVARELKVLALLENTATLKALDSKLPGARLDVDLAHLGLKTVFAEHKGGIIVVLGHYEDGAFVASDAAGKTIATVHAAELEELAKEHNVTLVKMGCLAAGSGGTGCATKFNTVEAVQRLANAASATTRAEFVERLGDKVAPMVFDPATFVADERQPNVRFSVNEPRTGVEVGLVEILFVAAAVAAAAPDATADPAAIVSAGASGSPGTPGGRAGDAELDLEAPSRTGAILPFVCLALGACGFGFFLWTRRRQ